MPNLQNTMSEDIMEIKRNINKIEEAVAASNNVEELNSHLALLSYFRQGVQKELSGVSLNDMETKDYAQSLLEVDTLLKNAEEKVQSAIDNVSNKENNGVKLGYTAGVRNHMEQEAKQGKAARFALRATAIAGAVAIVASSVVLYKKHQEAKAQEAQPTIENVQDDIIVISQAETKEEEKVEELSKEEKIMQLVDELTESFNKHQDINVSKEQVLALFIHLNVGNSYMNEEDTLALDKLTRESLIKKYFVGLDEESEEFKSYVITDDDLSKLSAEVFNLRNALVNRVIVLNDKGNYAESKELISLLQNFITETDIKDEAQELTESVCAMQTNDDTILKQEMYRYYNYIFAGPKSEVRNFDDYGSYKDIDGNDMTYENQGVTIRFYTWFIDTFVGIHSTKGFIPQDIINSKNAKLMDQSTILRMLGYKNCGASAFATYYNFDEPIDNKTTKTKSSKKGTGKSSGAVSAGTGNAVVDSQIDSILTTKPAAGSTYTLQDGSTMVVNSVGEKQSTVTIVANPSSAVVTEVTPAGPSEKTEVIGGGEVKEEDIVFVEDESEVILQQGGEVIVQPEVQADEISVNEEESKNEASISSIKAEINALKSLKGIFVDFDFTNTNDNFQKVKSC